MAWARNSYRREGSQVMLEEVAVGEAPGLCGAESCFEQHSAKSSSSNWAACLAWGRAMKRQPGDSFSLSEAVNKELANLGGQFLPVPPTLLGVGVANQTPRLTPYFSALLHLRLLFFLRSAANRSVLEAEKFITAVIWVLQNERMGIKQDTAWERVEKESVRLERESWSNKQ